MSGFWQRKNKAKRSQFSAIVVEIARVEGA